MKRLTLVRHAQSVPQNTEYITDWSRPLSFIGRQQCALMATKMADVLVSLPEIFYVSDAVRTRETYELITAALGVSTPVVLDHELYLTTARHMDRYCQELDDSYDHVAIVGHNPALAALGLQYSYAMIREFSTCGILSVLFQTESWAGAIPDSVENYLFLEPKMFRA